MGSKDLFEINTLDGLHAAKAVLRVRIRQRERDLQERGAKLPVEVIKATAGSVIPFFLNNKVAGVTWRLLKIIVGSIFRRRSTKKENFKESVLDSAKKWGWVTLAKALYGIFAKK
jgi:hypothetical protein